MKENLTQEEFRSKLAGILEQAKEQNYYIQERVVRDAFSEYEFSGEQMNMVLEFLRSKKVTIGGKASDLEAPGEPGGAGDRKSDAEGGPFSPAKKKEWSQAEDDYIRRYLEELNALRAPAVGSPEFLSAIRRAASGDASGGGSGAVNELLEMLLPRIADLAMDLYTPGILLQDLVQEGNLQGMLAAERFDFEAPLAEERFAKEVLSDVRSGMLTFIAENREVRTRDRRMVDRVEELNDYIEVLKDEMGRKVYVDEVAEFMDIPEEEVEAILRLTGGSVREDKSGDEPENNRE